MRPPVALALLAPAFALCLGAACSDPKARPVDEAVPAAVPRAGPGSGAAPQAETAAPVVPCGLEFRVELDADEPGGEPFALGAETYRLGPARRFPLERAFVTKGPAGHPAIGMAFTSPARAEFKQWTRSIAPCRVAVFLAGELQMLIPIEFPMPGTGVLAHPDNAWSREDVERFVACLTAG